METQAEFAELVAQIVSAYVRNNPVKADELPALIQQTRAALNSIDTPVPKTEQEPQRPAVPIKKSVAQDHITCLEDGKQFRSLRRHLKVNHNFTPAEYRAKWGLRQEYPTVAPFYSEARSKLAREAGLGQKGRQRKVRAA